MEQVLLCKNTKKRKRQVVVEIRGGHQKSEKGRIRITRTKTGKKVKRRNHKQGKSVNSPWIREVSPEGYSNSFLDKS